VGRLGKKRFIELRNRIQEELADVQLPALQSARANGTNS